MDRVFSRRAFIATLGVAGFSASLVGSIPSVTGFLGSSHTVRVMKFEPISERRYSRADIGHMTNKIYPDANAAMARRPHAGFKANLVEVELSCSQPVTTPELFSGRKDIDFRVASDMKRLQQFGRS